MAAARRLLEAAFTLGAVSALLFEVPLMQGYRLALPMLGSPPDKAALRRAAPIDGALLFTPSIVGGSPLDAAVLFYRTEANGQRNVVKIAANTSDPRFWTACRVAFFNANPANFASLPVGDVSRFFSFCVPE
jgi:hypothetical protein